MKIIKEIIPKAFAFLILCTLICGFLYTFAVTAFAQGFFSGKANGSIIIVNGKKYGSELLAQYYNNNSHMWGRIMNIDTTTFKNKNGHAVMYAWPSNLSPASDHYAVLISRRIKQIREADPAMGDEPVPQDLVTCSASGLDPHISVPAAYYQIDRIAKYTGKTKEQIRGIIDKYTTKRFLGIFGEPVVNVLKVNLALDGVLK